MTTMVLGGVPPDVVTEIVPLLLDVVNVYLLFVSVPFVIFEPITPRVHVYGLLTSSVYCPFCVRFTVVECVFVVPLK